MNSFRALRPFRFVVVSALVLAACGGQVSDDGEVDDADSAVLVTNQKHYVDLFASATRRADTTNASASDGALHAGTKYVFCKRKGAEVSVGGQYNHYWMLTSDNDTTGSRANKWVSAYYLSRWGNDQAKDNSGNTLPDCAYRSTGGGGTTAPSAVDKTRGDWYITQPNGYSCSATSLTMAEAAWHKASSNQATILRLTNAMHVTPSEGLPGNASLVAAQARRDGLSANFNSAASATAVRAELEKGHTCVVNGSLYSGGHFIYIGGLRSDGSFIVGDPARSYISSWSNADLNYFMNHNPGQHPNGFACVW